MTNNDELAMKMKAAAEKALPAIEKYEAGEIDGDDALEMLSDFTDAIKPANILALLAERDADKERIAELEGANASQDDHINQQQDRIDALEQRNSELGKYAGKLESISTAAEKLVRCKGRYHSEQNYRALAALFGVKTPDLPPLDTEARTVSVKFPKKESEEAVAYGGSGAFRMGRASGFNEAIDIMSERLAAAGIKLEAGE